MLMLELIGRAPFGAEILIYLLFLSHFTGENLNYDISVFSHQN